MSNVKEFDSVEVVDRTLVIKYKAGNVLNFEDCWLRDHCRCSTCYHADTSQRAQHILDIPDSTISSIWYDKSQLTITWDDEHESSYSSTFLSEFDYNDWIERRRLRPVLWHGNEVSQKIARVDVKDFLNSVDATKAVFQSLLNYGVALIEKVDPSLEATEPVCQALGGVQHTVFGGMWQFTTKADHADTAYTNLPLAVHNDNTYFNEAAGNKTHTKLFPHSRNLFMIKKNGLLHTASTVWNNLSNVMPFYKFTYHLQILHCIEHSNGTGGETILVDGFYGALKLKENYPEDFKTLTTFDVEAEYIEEGHHYRFSGPVIKIDQNSYDLEQIRYNVYDRSAMAFSSGEQCRSYYRSLRNLARYYQDPASEWRFKLRPGTVMVMDNFRLLHGRTAFTGTRVLCGSYVSRSDWLDKARAMHLIQ